MAELEQSLQGKLILDSGKLAGSDFDRTVVLVCRHGESGSFGLVLNRPSDRTLGVSVHESLPDELAKAPLYEGGPVQPEKMSFLHETYLQPECEIFPCLAIGHSLELLKQVTHDEEKRRVRVFSGYAGWDSGQLENEVKSGCWLIHPSSLSKIFDPQPKNLWRQILHEKGGYYRLLSEYPEDPSLN